MNLVFWLLCIIIGLVPAWFVFRHDRHKEIRVKWLPALLRWITVSATAALLLAPAFSREKTEEEKPLILWLQDNSASMQTSLGQEMADYKKEAERMQQQLGARYEVISLGFGGNIQRDSIYSFNQPTTDISAAVNAAYLQYEDRNIGAFVLASDGIYNQGADPHYTALGRPLPVYAIGLGDSTAPRDLQINRIMANKVVAKGSEFEILVDISAEKFPGRSTSAKLELNGHTLLQSAVKIDRERFHTTLRMEAKATTAGLQKYAISLPPFSEEENTLNNSMAFYVEVVDEEIKILLAASGPHPDIGALKQALEAVPSYKLDIRYREDVPDDLRGYGLVIAYQLPGDVALNLPEDMPVWYILGNQTSLPLFNRQQDVLRIEGAAAPNDALPRLNKGFSYFTLPAEIHEVLLKMPPLQVPYGRYATHGQVLLYQQIGAIVTDQPLWLLQSGSPSTAVLCGEGIWRWRMYAYKNFHNTHVVDELIRQTVSLLKVRKEDRSYRVYMDKYLLNDKEPVYLFAALRNENGELINQPDAQITLTDSSGKNLDFHFEKNGNSYQLNPGLLAAGSWSYKSTVTYQGKPQVATGNFTIAAVPLEQLRTHANYELLSFMSGQSEGAFFTKNNMAALVDSIHNNMHIKPVLHTVRTHISLIDWKWLFLFILLAAAFEWWLRKRWGLN